MSMNFANFDQCHRHRQSVVSGIEIDYIERNRTNEETQKKLQSLGFKAKVKQTSVASESK